MLLESAIQRRYLFFPCAAALMHSRMGSMHDVIVIGGGASGMFAAGCAAERGLRVLLLERNARLGRKLSITGNGRCNLTNTGELDEFIRHFGRNGRFLYRALTEFSNRDLGAFFDAHGVETGEEREGRVFPVSGGSEGVVRALERYMRKHRATVELESRARRIVVNPAAGAVSGIEVEGRGEILGATRIILATGGLSYPATGSTGDGYSMAKELGHTIVPLRPALVPLVTEEQFPKDLQGLSLDGVRVAALVNGREIASETGGMLFTHFGVSGPAVLALSGLIVEQLGTKKKVAISINLQPDADEAELERRLLGEFSSSGGKAIGTVMRHLMPKALVPIFLKSLGISADTKCSQITGGERRRMTALLMDFRLAIRKARPVDEAIVTRGGISLDEIDPRTMESKKVKGLYFCGEVIDVDGASGGYNLQAAFSTARLAAMNV
jgi:predicted Rossmann fold flavoprotein